MKLSKTTGFVTGLLMTLSVAAHASEPTPYHPVSNWNSVYGTAGLGAGAFVLKADTTDEDETFSLDGVGGEGIFGTIGVGADRQMGRYVIGGFADFDFGNISLKADGQDINDTYEAEIKLSNMWTIGGRAGVLVNPSTLVYGLVGYSQGKFDAEVFSTDPTDVNGSGSERFSGFTLGTGMETLLNDRMSLKLEYRFTQFREKDIDDGFFSIGNVDDTDDSSLEPSLHTARLTFSYRFGYDHMRAASYK